MISVDSSRKEVILERAKLLLAEPWNYVGRNGSTKISDTVVKEFVKAFQDTASEGVSGWSEARRFLEQLAASPHKRSQAMALQYRRVLEILISRVGQEAFSGLSSNECAYVMASVNCLRKGGWQEHTGTEIPLPPVLSDTRSGNTRSVVQKEIDPRLAVLKNIDISKLRG